MSAPAFSPRMSSLQSTLPLRSDPELKSYRIRSPNTWSKSLRLVTWWQSQFIAEFFTERAPLLRVKECVAAMTMQSKTFWFDPRLTLNRLFFVAVVVAAGASAADIVGCGAGRRAWARPANTL